jgi:hypothetical protein
MNCLAWRQIAASAVAMLVLAHFSACGGSEPEPEPEPPEPMVLVGTGVTAFEAVEMLDGVPLIAGPQGGYHLWLSVQCQDLGPHVIIDYGVRDTDTGERLTFEGLFYAVDLVPAGKWMQWTAMPGFLEPPFEKENYFGRNVTLWAHVEDEDGVSGSDEAETHVLDKLLSNDGTPLTD